MVLVTKVHKYDVSPASVHLFAASGASCQGVMLGISCIIGFKNLLHMRVITASPPSSRSLCL